MDDLSKKASQQDERNIWNTRKYKTCYYFASFLDHSINTCLKDSCFPLDFQLANVAPVLKNKSKTWKDNSRPISILPNISKTDERFIYLQIQFYFEDILSDYQCGFLKGYGPEHCPVTLMINWQKSVHNDGASVA